MSGSCLIQLAALVVTFKGPESRANFTNLSVSGDLSSLLLQFKTSQHNTRIAGMNQDEHKFAVDIQNGFLHIAYNLNDTGNGLMDIRPHLVNTNEWFVLNITSQANNTHVRLTKSNLATSLPCTADYDNILNITLLGQGFSALFRTAGITIGGEIIFNHQLLKPFEGCIGAVNLGNHPLVLNQSTEGKTPSYFTRHDSGITDGCPCSQSPCKNGVYLWDQTKGSCDCKCSMGYHGTYCQNRTTMPTPKDDNDDIDSEFLYLVVGITIGVLVLVSIVVCVIVYCRRTSTSMFGVYNPKVQEQVQGQQLQTTLKVPVPEKLI